MDGSHRRLTLPNDEYRVHTSVLLAFPLYHAVFFFLLYFSMLGPGQHSIAHDINTSSVSNDDEKMEAIMSSKQHTLKELVFVFYFFLLSYVSFVVL